MNDVCSVDVELLCMKRVAHTHIRGNERWMHTKHMDSGPH